MRASASPSRWVARFWLLWFGIVVSGPGAWALDSSKAVTQFRHRTWGARDGLGPVNTVAQTADGCLWVGAANGLFQFDGFRFERWEPAPGEPNLPIPTWRMIGSIDGSLWAASGDDLLRIHKGHSTLYSATNGLPGRPTTALFQGPDGSVWCGSQLGLVRFKDERWERMGADQDYPEGGTVGLCATRDGTLWAIVGNPAWQPKCKLIALRPGETRFRVLAPGFDPAFRLAQGPDDRLWISPNNQSIRPLTLDADGFREGHPRVEPSSTEMIFDRDGNLWTAAVAGGVVRARRSDLLNSTHDLGLSDQMRDRFTQKDGFSSDFINCFFEDREGNIWCGTAAGLDCFSDAKFTPFSRREGLPSDQKFLVQALPEGGIMTAAVGQGFLQIDPEEPTIRILSWLGLKGLAGLPQPDSMMVDTNGDLLVGCGLGVLRVPAGTTNAIRTPNPHKLDSILAMARDRSGRLWVCDRNKGVFYETNGVTVKFDRPEFAEIGPILSVFGDARGRVWFGSAKGGVYVWHEDRLRRYSTAEGLFPGEIRLIQPDGAGRIWVAGAGGLARFGDDRFHTLNRRRGLPAENLFALLFDDSGDLWCGGLEGVFRASPAALDSALGDDSAPVAGTLYTVEDGLRGMVREITQGFSGLSSCVATKDTRGRLWFATSSGLAMVDPARLPRNGTAPSVRIRQIVAGNTTNGAGANLALPVGTRSCQIDYAAFSYTQPERVRFQTRLEGHDLDWVDMDHRRQAFYADLKPKAYLFRVRAANEDGVWDETGASVSFAVLPAFYERLWFPPLCLAVAGLALFALHRFRLSRVEAGLNRQLETQKQERKRIAQELHDTLLQGFTGIGLKLEALATQLPESLGGTRKQLETILDQSDHYLAEARRAVWELRSANGSCSESLLRLMERSVARLLDGAGIAYRCVESGERRPLPPAFEANLLRICEEAVSNAAKHARPENISVELVYDASEVRLAIEDDGDGFDPNIAEAKSGHFGLAGMRERAAASEGRISITSTLNRGTRIVVTVSDR
jgi:signal transduction histidine kinase/ligand-binding sensor domain-containing protein